MQDNKETDNDKTYRQLAIIFVIFWFVIIILQIGQYFHTKSMEGFYHEESVEQQNKGDNK